MAFGIDDCRSAVPVNNGLLVDDRTKSMAIYVIHVEDRRTMRTTQSMLFRVLSDAC